MNAKRPGNGAFSFELKSSFLIQLIMHELRQKVSEILLNHWDPIGIVDEPNAQDEYDEYVNTICGMLRKGTTESAIKQFLIEIEIDWMKMSPDVSRAARVANKILSI